MDSIEIQWWLVKDRNKVNTLKSLARNQSLQNPCPFIFLNVIKKIMIASILQKKIWSACCFKPMSSNRDFLWKIEIIEMSSNSDFLWIKLYKKTILRNYNMGDLFVAVVDIRKLECS